MKTSIARCSRISAHLQGTYIESADAGRTSFEKHLRATPERAAHVILRGVSCGHGRPFNGTDARAIDWIQQLVPAGYQALTPRFARSLGQQRTLPETPKPIGAV